MSDSAGRKATLLRLKRMDAIDGVACAQAIVSLWDQHYGRAVFRGGYLRLATGGWSENEEILEYLPKLFHFFYWHRSERGGLSVYRVPKLKRAEGKE